MTWVTIQSQKTKSRCKDSLDWQAIFENSYENTPLSLNLWVTYCEQTHVLHDTRLSKMPFYNWSKLLHSRQYYTCIGRTAILSYTRMQAKEGYGSVLLLKCKQEGFSKSFSKEGEPFHIRHIDHIGSLSPTSKNCNHVLTITDAFTKYTWILTAKSRGTREFLDKFEILQKHFSNPLRVIGDNGVAFDSLDFKNFCEINNIYLHLTSTTDMPRESGQVQANQPDFKSRFRKNIDWKFQRAPLARAACTE